MASLAARKGENERAVELLRRALIANPNSFAAQIQLGQTLIDSNRMEEAIRLLEINVTGDPRPYRGRVLLGMAYMHLKEYEKAKENYEAAIAAHPKHANAHFGLATACARLGQDELHQKYIARFRELHAGEREIATDQRHRFDDLGSACAEVAAIYSDAAKICLPRGRPAEAELLCRRAAVLDASNVDCRQALAWMHLERGEPAETIRMFEQLAGIEPENVTYRQEIARLFAATGRSRAAEEALRKACDEAPRNAAAYAALADFLMSRTQNFEEAVKAARTAVELAPTSSNHVLLGAAHEKNGEIPEAVDMMAKAVELAPRDLRVLQMYELLKDQGDDKVEE
jgi:tetratricopeptide (TPR) repeat protein